MSAQSRQELARFIGRSVLPNTNRVYDKCWELWTSFLKSEVDEDDPFLRCAGEEEKASLVGIMMLRRHEQGLRDKQATFFAPYTVLAAGTLCRLPELICDCDDKGGVQV